MEVQKQQQEAEILQPGHRDVFRAAANWKGQSSVCHAFHNTAAHARDRETGTRRKTILLISNITMNNITSHQSTVLYYDNNIIQYNITRCNNKNLCIVFRIS